MPLVSVSAAAELAVFIPDAAPAIVPIIELCPDPAIVLGLAQGAERVAAHVNARATLGVIARRDDSSAAAGALQVSVVVDDVAGAAVKVERGRDPIAVDVFAASAKLVTADVNVAASFAVGTPRAVAAPIVAVAVPVTAGVVVHASQLSVNIGDAGIATRGRQRCVYPVTGASLAAGIQPSKAHADVAAGGGVVASGQTSA